MTNRHELCLESDTEVTWVLSGPGAEKYSLINQYLGYLADRNYSPRTLRAYGYDLLVFCRWLDSEDLDLGSVTTDIDELTLVCGSHHRLVKPGGWITRKRANGDTEWIPPSHLDFGQPRTNSFHHPEKLLCNNKDHEDHDPVMLRRGCHPNSTPWARDNSRE
jgi:hypothetical protein